MCTSTILSPEIPTAAAATVASNVHFDNTLTRDSYGSSSNSSSSSNGSPELHEDLSDFFSEDLLSSLATGQPFATLNAQIPHSGYSSMPLDSHLASTSPNSWASPPPTTPSTGHDIFTSDFEPFEHHTVVNHGQITPHLASTSPNSWASPPPTTPSTGHDIFTSDFEPFEHHTVVNHGQITPCDSPKDLRPLLHESTESTPTMRRQSRKRKEVAAVTTTTTNATAVASVESEKSPKRLKGSEAKVKKPTKSQQLSKKTALEIVAAKREAFLKRNKEAAYKCRMKIKTQRVEDAERMKVLTEDNASMGLEIEKLRSEVCGLKGLVLSHYRECGDQRLMEYLGGDVGAGEGVDPGRHGEANLVGSVEESLEDGGMNIDEEEAREEPKQRPTCDMEEEYVRLLIRL
ncbi:hypothetical protein V498_07199 [Pseudogymnoascus sp. VKM F-4517 (FW-2822)]|nr:hypothetical protein V498_07199 [Pseudogymnoascus sp. VKM F-4517 (FW-2822)]